MSRTDYARARYLAWVKENFPSLYSEAFNSVGPAPVVGALSGLGDVSSWFTSISNTIKDLGSAYLESKAQADLLKINTQRAQAGYPPLDANYQAMMGQPGYQSGVSAIPPVVLYGALALGVFLLIRK